MNQSFTYKLSKNCDEEKNLNFPESSYDYKTLVPSQVNEGLMDPLLVFNKTVHSNTILLRIFFHVYKNKCLAHLRSSPLSLAPSHLCFLSLLSSFPFPLLLHRCPFPWEHLKMSQKKKNSLRPQIRSVTEITRRDYRGQRLKH